MFRAVPLSTIKEFCTVHTGMVCIIQVLLTACEHDQDGTGLRPDPARKLSVKPV